MPVLQLLQLPQHVVELRGAAAEQQCEGHCPQTVCDCAGQGDITAVRRCSGAAAEGSGGAQRTCGRMSCPTTASRQPALRSHRSRQRSASRRCAATSDCTSAPSSRAASCATCHNPLGMS